MNTTHTIKEYNVVSKLDRLNQTELMLVLAFTKQCKALACTSNN